jgi:hypothetical protein
MVYKVGYMNSCYLQLTVILSVCLAGWPTPLCAVQMYSPLS